MPGAAFTSATHTNPGSPVRMYCTAFSGIHLPSSLVRILPLWCRRTTLALPLPTTPERRSHCCTGKGREASWASVTTAGVAEVWRSRDCTSRCTRRLNCQLPQVTISNSARSPLTIVPHLASVQFSTIRVCDNTTAPVPVIHHPSFLFKNNRAAARNSRQLNNHAALVRRTAERGRGILV